MQETLGLPDPHSGYFTDVNRVSYLGVILMPDERIFLRSQHPSIARKLVFKGNSSFGYRIVGDLGLNRYEQEELETFLMNLEP